MTEDRLSERPNTVSYDTNVFINCPFDSDYEKLLRALVFAVQDCGFVARTAMEVTETGEVRLHKICRLISECRHGLHDLSRVELDISSGLPRFNMPLELGIFLGAQRFGDSEQSRKRYLVLERDRYRYHMFCSDISGQDIVAHGNEPRKIMKAVRRFLQTEVGEETVIPSARTIHARFEKFEEDLPGNCEVAQLDHTDLEYPDLIQQIVSWQGQSPW